MSEHAETADRLTVTTTAKYPDYADDPHRDELILINGTPVGGTYICADETWASYGPAGLSLRHPSRQDATDVQVREYATNPDRYDRLIAEARAEADRERARQEADNEKRRAAWAAKRRRARLGDDSPGPTIATVPAYHALYADPEEVRAVSDWLTANGIDSASAVHEIRVEQRATRQVIVFEAPRSFAADRGVTETWVVTMTVGLPPVRALARPDLHDLLDAHWPTQFPLIDYGKSLGCGQCTSAAGDARTVVAWPCATVADAVAG